VFSTVETSRYRSLRGFERYGLVTTIDFRDSPFPLPRSYDFFALHRLEFHEAGRDADLIVLHGANVLAGLFFNYLEM
jgi:hypothetical protein